MIRFLVCRLLPLLLVFLSILTIGQSKYDKAFTKAETKFDQGLYVEADELLEKFKSKTDKKFGKENEYTLKYLQAKAKYSLAEGLTTNFETYLLQAIKTSSQLNATNPQAHAEVLLEAGNLYNEFGHYVKSSALLIESRELLKKSGTLTPWLQARVDLALGECLKEQGYYNEASRLLNSEKNLFAGLIQKQPSEKNAAGEIKIRLSLYARWLTTIADIHRKRGNLKSADSAFVSAAIWIQRNVGQRTVEYARNQLYFSDLLVENGLSPKSNFPKHAGYDDALLNVIETKKGSHVLAMRIYERYLRRLQVEGNNSKFNSVFSDYSKFVNDYFPRTSLYQVRRHLAEYSTEVENEQIGSIISAAMVMMAGNANLPKQHWVTAEIYDYLFDLSIYQKNFIGAENYIARLIEINSQLYGKEAPVAHLSKLKYANYLMDYSNRIKDALKIYNSSYDSAIAPQIGPWHKDHLIILNHLSSIYELTDDYKKSTETIEKASDLAHSKYANNDPLYGIELTLMAGLRIKLGQYESAGKELKEAMDILSEHRKEDEWKPAYVKVLETQAKLYGVKGLFSDAEEAIDDMADFMRKNRNEYISFDEQSSARELTSLFIQLGRYAQSEEILNDLIKEYQQYFGSNSIRLLEPLVNKGNLLLAKGEYTDADKVAQQAYQLALSTYGDQSTKTVPAQKLLSDIFYTLGDYDRAESNTLKTIQSQQAQYGKNHLEVAKSLSQLGMIRFTRGDTPKSVEATLLEARNIISQRLGTDNPPYAEVLKNIAVLDIAQKKFPEAIQLLGQADQIWRAKTGSKNSVKAAGIFVLTGDVYYHMRNYETAEDFYNRGKSIYESNFSKKHPEYVKILSKLSRIYYMTGDFKKSKRNIEEALTNYETYIKEFFPALSERQKTKYWNTIKSDFEFFNTLAFSKADDFRDLTGKVYNYQLLTKALLLSSSIKIRENIQNSANDELKTLFNQWMKKKETLTQVLSMSNSQISSNGIITEALTAEVEKMEKELGEKSEIFNLGFESKKVTYENIQKSLKEKEVAIEILRYRHFNHTFTDSIVYVGLYITSDNQRPKIIRLSDGNQMENRYYKYYRNAMVSRIRDMYSYKIFWEPIEKEIGVSYTNIYFSPDGVYNLINLESIPIVQDKDEYIIDRANLITVNNTKDLYLRKIRLKEPTKSNSATMFGNPRFYSGNTGDRRIADLPGTEKEVDQLNSLLSTNGWNTAEYTESLASEEQVKKLNNPKIFHIATHGYYSPAVEKNLDQEMTITENQLSENPLMKSGLLLKGAGDILSKTDYNYNMENGVLTAYEAMNLNLDNTDLVVLSACETGLGEVMYGEGVYGLQRAFLVAGAKMLIMSMFKVDDEATQKLILSFYNKWLATGKIRESFTAAKKELRTEYEDPIFWGAFMMVGLE
jgi:CHAT domain-containing protein